MILSDDFEDDRRKNNNRINCGLRNVGAVVDIPINRIAAFVHNAYLKVPNFIHLS